MGRFLKCERNQDEFSVGFAKRRRALLPLPASVSAYGFDATSASRAVAQRRRAGEGWPVLRSSTAEGGGEGERLHSNYGYSIT